VSSTRLHLSNMAIAALEGGNAPWQVSRTQVEQIPLRPFNPVTGKPIQGANALRLWMSPHRDPRWYTIEQIQELGLRLNKEAVGIPLVFQVSRQLIQDEQGGASVGVPLSRPHTVLITVFNAEVLDGVKTLERAPFEAEALPFGRAMLAAMGSQIVHDQSVRTFYVQSRDEVHLPAPDRFRNEAEYLAKAVHESLHATSHATRLNRDIGRSFTTMEYAREEMRTQIASLLLSSRTGLLFSAAGHEQHTPSWVEILRGNPAEIYQIGKESEQMVEFAMQRVRQFELTQTKTQAPAQDLAGERPPKKKWRPDTGPHERIYLFVPYEERMEAKKLGARLDETRTPKQWYILANRKSEPFAKWLTPPAVLTKDDVLLQFQRECEHYGLLLEDTISVDGEWHHTKVTTSKNQHKKAGAYTLDPNTWRGYIKNHDTGIETTGGWKPDGQVARDGKQEEYLAQMQANREAREREQLATYERMASTCDNRWQKAPDAYDVFPYLVRKQVPSYGLKVLDGNLMIPLVDLDHKIWNLQKIPSNPNGQKLYEKDARKQGLFYLLGSLEDATTVVFAEGYATAASIHKATGLTVIICFDSGNIPVVMRNLADRLTGVDKIIAGDNDLVTYSRLQNTLNNAKVREKEPYPEIQLDHIVAALKQDTPLLLGESGYAIKLREDRAAEHFEIPRIHAEVFKGETRILTTMINNAGMEKALGAAVEHNAKVIAPKFADPQAYDKGWKDFNDLHVHENLDQVRFQIGAAVDLVKGKEIAHQYVREGKYNLVELIEPAPDGRYVGQVVAQAGFHAIQDIGRHAAVAHPLNKLDKIPVTGSVARIQYQDGHGHVSEPPPRNRELSK